MDHMDNFAGNEVKIIRSTKNTWYDWLINYIPEPIRKSVLALLRQIHLT